MSVKCYTVVNIRVLCDADISIEQIGSRLMRRVDGTFCRVEMQVRVQKQMTMHRSVNEAVL